MSYPTVQIHHNESVQIQHTRKCVNAIRSFASISHTHISAYVPYEIPSNRKTLSHLHMGSTRKPHVIIDIAATERQSTAHQQASSPSSGPTEKSSSAESGGPTSVGAERTDVDGTDIKDAEGCRSTAWNSAERCLHILHVWY